MMTSLVARMRRRQRGAAAVEAALLMPILVVLLVFPLLLGRIFWHYAVIQKAAHDAARYLSSVPIAEMKNQIRGPHAAALARDIVNAEIAELYSGSVDSPVAVNISCDDNNCDLGVPTTVTVLVGVRMYDPLFSSMTGDMVGEDGLLLRAKVVMRYVGQ